MKPNELLDPVHLSTISDFYLLARTVADGFLAGLHRSLSHGRGTEFFQYRPYTQGEDLKYIDWKVFARSDELVTKTFEEETNTTCYFVIDASASMGYQGSGVSFSKLHYSAMTAAALGYLAQRQGDSVGLVVYNSEIQEWLEPRYSVSHFKYFLQLLSQAKPEGVSDHAKAWNTLVPKLPGRGMVIYLSDMLEAENELPELLKFGQTHRYDCLSIQVLDRDEIEFPFQRAMNFEDIESGKFIMSDPETIRQQYLEQMDSFLADVREGMMRAGSDFLRVTTDTELGKTLGHYLHHRERMRL